MKTLILVVFAVINLWTTSLLGQTSEKETDKIAVTCNSSTDKENQPLYVVNGILISDKETLKSIAPQDIVSVDLLKGEEALARYGESGRNGVIVVQTKRADESLVCDELENLPFPVRCTKNEGWMIQQDIYNTLISKVPSLTISNNSNPISTPRIRIRGKNSPIVLLDGIRVDVSFLNMLNPQDIESIHVAPSAAGAHYFLNGFRTN